MNILHKPARSFLRDCKFDQERNLNDNSIEYKHLPLRPRTNPDIQPKEETDKSLTECEAKQQIYFTTAKDWILLTNNTNKNNHIMTINVYSGYITLDLSLSLSAVQRCTGQLTASMFQFQLRSFCVEFALIPVSA